MCKKTQVVVKLFATYQIGRFKEEARICPAQTDVGDVIKALDINLEISGKGVGVVLVNGLHAPLDQLLAEGDVLSIFPLVGGG